MGREAAHHADQVCRQVRDLPRVPLPARALLDAVENLAVGVVAGRGESGPSLWEAPSSRERAARTHGEGAACSEEDGDAVWTAARPREQDAPGFWETAASKKTGRAVILGNRGFPKTGRARILGRRGFTQTGRVRILGGRVRILGGRVRILGGRVRILGSRVRILGSRVRILGGRARILGRRVRIPGSRARILGGRARIPGGRARILGGRVRILEGRVRIPGSRARIPGGRARIVEGRVSPRTGRARIRRRSVHSRTRHARHRQHDGAGTGSTPGSHAGGNGSSSPRDQRRHAHVGESLRDRGREGARGRRLLPSVFGRYPLSASTATPTSFPYDGLASMNVSFRPIFARFLWSANHTGFGKIRNGARATDFCG